MRAKGRNPNGWDLNCAGTVTGMGEGGCWAGSEGESELVDDWRGN